MFDTLMAPLFLLGCALLAIAGIGCLFYCRGKNRRYLAWAAGIFLTALVLWIGGDILLGFFQMVWRTGPSAVFYVTLLISGWVGVVLTMGCFLTMERPGIPPPSWLWWGMKGVVLFFSGLILCVTLWFGPLAFLFLYNNEERVVEYQGQTLVEVDDGFLDDHYSYYLYYGPLVRGTERVYEGETHLWGDIG